MACILKPECNYLHGYFRCLLPLETVDVEVKVKKMTGITMFRRGRNTQFILCNPWSTRLYPYPSLIRKMKTYLELEGKLGPKHRPQPQTQSQLLTSTPSKNNNSLTKKTPGPKMAEKDEENQNTCKKKVQGEGNCQALTYQPNYDYGHEPNPCPHSSHFHCIHPDAHDEISNHVNPSDCIQFGKGKIWRNSLPHRKAPSWRKSFCPNCSPS